MTDLTLRNIIRQVLEKSEIDAFGLREWGGNADEIALIREHTIRQIWKLVGARTICFGCGAWTNECRCGLHVEYSKT